MVGLKDELSLTKRWRRHASPMVVWVSAWVRARSSCAWAQRALMRRSWVCAQLLGHVWFCVTLWTVACQAPLSKRFSQFRSNKKLCQLLLLISEKQLDSHMEKEVCSSLLRPYAQTLLWNVSQAALRNRCSPSPFRRLIFAKRRERHSGHPKLPIIELITKQHTYTHPLPHSVHTCTFLSPRKYLYCFLLLSDQRFPFSFSFFHWDECYNLLSHQKSLIYIIKSCFKERPFFFGRNGGD